MPTCTRRICTRLAYVLTAGIIARLILRIARPASELAVSIVYGRIRNAVSDSSFGQDKYTDGYG